MEPLTVLDRPVPHGPRAYRGQVRRLGPLAGLVPPAVLGVLALVLLEGNSSAWRGLSSYLCAVLAAPCLLVAGVPLSSGTGVYLVGIAGSAVIWLALGTLAARRATRRPVATWRDFWREYLWLAGGVWLGVILALGIVALVLGRPVF
jgi:hypothetical protein